MTSSNTSWLETFGIADRVGTPDLLMRRDAAIGAPHSTAIERTFEESVDAFLAIQDVPTVAFTVRDSLDLEEIDHLHKTLWNQGLASLLVVRLPTEVRVYSVWERPVSTQQELRDQRLVETLLLSADALRIHNLVRAVESGEYFERNREHFDPTTRVDATLLGNLRETLVQLAQSLPADSARALVLQTVFISYLEDRGILDVADFRTAGGNEVKSLLDLLSCRDPNLLVRLFSHLKKVFNGDVFHAPGAFESNSDTVSLRPDQIAALIDFRSGWKEMGTGQLRFWGYDFRFIPVELISSIYDRFLNEDDTSRKAIGAYFTPRFLADLVVDQVWNSLDPDVRSSDFTVLDPSCGSAIFLVRMFHKIAEQHRRAHPGRFAEWSELLGWLERLHGWDVSESAVRIGAFSLYIALLEQVHPPVVRALKAQGKILPRLLGRTLVCRDFFGERRVEPAFDVVVGNPPWVSRQPEKTKVAAEWCRQHEKPMPGGELAWAFIWKVAQHLKPNGRVALLLPAMGILLNHSKEVAAARALWIGAVAIQRVINFADVCFQLFDGADRPTVMALYRLERLAEANRKVDYWVPKAHRLLSSTRLLIVPTVDQLSITEAAAKADPGIWKKRMWATNRDLKLLSWLSDMPRLNSIAKRYSEVRRQRRDPKWWVIGQGFQPFHSNPQRTTKGKSIDTPDEIRAVPFMETSCFAPWVIPSINASPWPAKQVRRAGYPEGFAGPHILVPQGVIRTSGYVRAAFVEQSLSFQDSLQAITFPEGEEPRAKLLTAILNSSLAAWYYFHTSANLGADRAKVHEEQLLEIPFPSPEETPDPEEARQAQKKIIAALDHLLRTKDEILSSNSVEAEAKRVDEFVFDYYGLSDEERTLVRDSLEFVVPSMQPRRDAVTRLMERATLEQRKDYCRTLVRTLRSWLQPGTDLGIRLIESGGDALLVELRLGVTWMDVVVDHAPKQFQIAMARILAQLSERSSRNVEMQPNLKVFLKDSLYLTKPLSRRYWLQSAALNDADDIAGDLLAAEGRQPTKRKHERR